MYAIYIFADYNFNFYIQFTDVFLLHLFIYIDWQYVIIPLNNFVYRHFTDTNLYFQSLLLNFWGEKLSKLMSFTTKMKETTRIVNWRLGI